MLNTSFSHDRDVHFYKAVHELDGQTYVIKKRRIFISPDQDIKEHPAYDEIISVKDTKKIMNIRYVNSWVELDSECSPNSTMSNGLNVYLCIQMRYIPSSANNFSNDHELKEFNSKDLEKLARDLIILSGTQKDLDEDTLYDMSEDLIDDARALTDDGVSFKDAIIKTFSTIGYTDAITPTGLEQEIWRICFDNALALI